MNAEKEFTQSVRHSDNKLTVTFVRKFSSLLKHILNFLSMLIKKIGEEKNPYIMYATLLHAQKVTI